MPHRVVRRAGQGVNFWGGVVQVLMKLAAGAGLLLLLGSYGGALHPLGDSLAVFRLWLAGGTGAAALVLGGLRARGWAVLCIAACVAAGAPILVAMAPGREVPPSPEVTIYVKNLGSARADVAPLVSDIEQTGADILLFQEVTRENAARLQAMLPQHRHWHICQFSGWSGMVVAARWPLSETLCTPHRSLARAEVAAPQGAIDVASIHQVWPYPHEQAVLLPTVLQALDAQTPRRIVAGDFNMVPWSHAFRAIARASGTARIGPVRNTILVRDVPLSIDHVLTNGAGAVSLRPQFGSDHFGLLAHIAFAEPPVASRAEAPAE